MGALTSVAQCAGREFAPFYPTVMPGIKQILANARGPHFAELRGLTMQSVGAVGATVGPAAFARDAQEVMQHLVETMRAGEATAQQRGRSLAAGGPSYSAS